MAALFASTSLHGVVVSVVDRLGYERCLPCAMSAGVLLPALEDGSAAYPVAVYASEGAHATRSGRERAPLAPGPRRLRPPLRARERRPLVNAEAGTILRLYASEVREGDELARDRVIARLSHLLLACPSGFVPAVRSGTWATVRYALAASKPVLVCLPDGTFARALTASCRAGVTLEAL